MRDDDGELKYGCAIFDDPCLHQTGWRACGEEAAARMSFEGTGTLASDTVWLTNLPYDVSAQSGLLQNYRFQKSDYLREDITRLAARHGVAGGRETAEFGAKLFSRVLRLASCILRFPSDYVPRYGLKYGIRENLLARDPVYERTVARIIEEAVSYNCNCERASFGRGETKTVYFKAPPREHCLNILSIPLPRGEFAERKDVPRAKDRKAVVEWVRGLPPGFFRVTASRFDEGFNRLINFGVSPLASRRQWLSTPEVLWIASFADVVVHQALVAEDRFVPDEILALVKKLPEITDLSLSMGIFYENLWTGAATRLPAQCRKPDQASVNPFTPFLRAMDRILLFQKAHALALAGLDVTGYATGVIRVGITEDEDASTLYTAAKNGGLIPPFLELDPDMLPPPAAPLEHAQWHYACSRLESLLQLDLKITEKICAEQQ